MPFRIPLDQRPRRRLRHGLARKLQAIAHVAIHPVRELTPLGQERIRDIYLDTHSISSAASRLGISRESVERELIRQGLVRIDSGRRVSVESAISMALAARIAREDSRMRARATAAGLILPSTSSIPSS